MPLTLFHTKVKYYYPKWHSFTSGFEKCPLTHFIFLGGNTRTGDAIRYMMDKIFSIENGSRPAVKKHMVLLTDGRSQVNRFFDRTYDNLKS